MSFREQIEAQLDALIGEQLSAVSRAGATVMVGFGPLLDRVGRSGHVRSPRLSLHISTTWRITAAEGIVTGSRDLFYPAGDPFDEPPDFEWDVPHANRADDRLTALVLERLRVENIVATDEGDLTLRLSGNHTLQIFIDSGVPEERWRFIGSDHLVVMPSAFEL